MLCGTKYRAQLLDRQEVGKVTALLKQMRIAAPEDPARRDDVAIAEGLAGLGEIISRAVARAGGKLTELEIARHADLTEVLYAAATLAGAADEEAN
jgi:hypothetical protein